MKKYIYKIALLILGVSTLVSCDEDTVTYGGKNFVTFGDVASTRVIAIEDKGDNPIPINLAFPMSKDLVVTLEVDGGTVAIEGVHFTVPSRTVTIPAGEVTANFIITPINNEVLNDSKPVNVKIVSVDDSGVSVGISDVGSADKRVVLLNEDCTTRFTDLLGTFNVYDDANALLGTAFVDINDAGDCNVLRVSGVVESVLGREADSYIEMTLVPGTGATAKTRGTITSYQQLYCQECYNNPNNGFNETWLLTPGGSFNTVTQQLVISGPYSTASGYYKDIASAVVLMRP